MNGLETRLEQAYIKNFLSLRDVELPFKPLTVLVGPNASGKTNVLTALSLLNRMMIYETPPPAPIIEDDLWAGGANSIYLKLQTCIQGKMACYKIELRPEEGREISLERLTIEGVEVISVKDGEGYVQDEDNTNQIDYRSEKLALRSAGDYGRKPTTRSLTAFIRSWEFYDIRPGKARTRTLLLPEGQLTGGESAEGPPPVDRLLPDGSNLHRVLTHWHENDQDRFQAVNQAFKSRIKFEIMKHFLAEDISELSFHEGYPSPIPLHMVSDGTLRLLAYLVLLNQPVLPSLMAIEEPERNFHPAWLSTLSDILDQLSRRTQVIIATHSSQLLDTFEPQSLLDNLSIVLLRNIPGKGTEAISLDKVQEDRESLTNWINEFGIGSAIFDSELLQDTMEA
jgi:predicted ATPase